MPYHRVGAGGNHGLATLFRQPGPLQFRQEWIDKVIDTFCEYHAILMTRHAAPFERRKEEVSVIDPDEKDPIALLKLIDEIAQTTDTAQREAKDGELVLITRRHLKSEWTRIKNELG